MIACRHTWLVVMLALVLAGRGAPGRGADDAAGDIATFLADKGIDRPGRQVIEASNAWDDTVQQAALRVLLRLAAPRELAARWRSAAVGLGDGPPTVADRLVAVRGRAVFAAPRRLSPEQRELAAGREQFDVVRIVDESGVAVDVLAFAAPKAWLRSRPIDEPVTVFGLPLSTTVDPRPAGLADWPAAPPALVVAATHIAWTPETPLGALGMDYALFDTVVDGRRLEPGDTEAFFDMLAAVGGQPDAPAGPPTDIVPLIDPAQKWFAKHRGDKVVIAGDVRRATRIAIDEPERRAAVGADHYWELFVFVPTPVLNVDGTIQDSFPVVCCVRELPAGMPRGDRISESVVVPGFALKRYAYPLDNAVIGDEVRKGERRETPLVIGRRAIWRPAPATTGASDMLFAVFASLAGLVAAALAWGIWSMRRDARLAAARARAQMPETLTLPEGRD